MVSNQITLNLQMEAINVEKNRRKLFAPDPEMKTRILTNRILTKRVINSSANTNWWMRLMAAFATNTYQLKKEFIYLFILEIKSTRDL